MILLRKFFATAAALATVAAAPSLAQTVVVPGANASVEGNGSNVFPFFSGTSFRYQQVFDASAFSSLTGPKLISGFDLREDTLFQSAFTYSTSAIRILLSTTNKAADGLSLTFADNVGADAMQVYNGALSLSSAGGRTGDGGTSPFDISVTFQTPFLYDRTAGNLLLEVSRSSAGSSRFSMDAENSTGDVTSRLYSSSATATTGTADSLGLVVRFHTADMSVPAAAVPEPATWGMMILGVGAIGYAMRRRQKVSVSYAA